MVRSAQGLGIPAALCVASWDHLTTKGLMRVQPDLVAVWNETQKREAVAFHGVSPDRVAVTGAQPFDKWFGRAPSRDRDAFCRMVGLRPERPFILFTGSSESISAPDLEVTFVRRWVAYVRRGLRDTAGEAGVLVRPHPFNAAHWATADLSDLEDVVVFPRHAVNPVDEGDRADYFDSLHHAAAVVGVNTSAMVEAAIVGRPVLSVLAGEFAHTQGGTLHFQYLLPENGGCVQVARGLDEHVEQLADALRSPEAHAERLDRFVSSFVRPLGRDVAGTPVLADALEGLAGRGRTRPARAALGRVPFGAARPVPGRRDVGRLRDADRSARERHPEGVQGPAQALGALSAGAGGGGPARRRRDAQGHAATRWLTTDSRPPEGERSLP